MSTPQRGMAVLTVLLLIALMTLLAVTAQDRFQQAVRGAQSARFAMQSGWSLLGAESWLLQQSPAVPQGVQQLQLEQDLIHYQWRDRQACFNLNVLGRKTAVAESSASAAPATHHAQQPDADGSALQPLRTPDPDNASASTTLTSAQRVFLRLLTELDVPSERAKKMTLALSAQLQRGAFIESSELRAPIQGFDPALWPRLAPLVCALPAERLQVNVNGLTDAQLPLFTALFDGALSAVQARDLLSRRPATGWKTLADMLASSPLQSSDRTSLLLSVAVTQSQALELLLWTGDAQHSSSLRSRVVLHEKQWQISDRLYGLSE